MQGSTMPIASPLTTETLSYTQTYWAIHPLSSSTCKCVAGVFSSHRGKPQRPNNNVVKLLNMAWNDSIAFLH